MKRVYLTNKFHNTETYVLAPEGTTPEEAWEDLQYQAWKEDGYGPARRRLARVAKALCGMADCACGIYRPY